MDGSGDDHNHKDKQVRADLALVPPTPELVAAVREQLLPTLPFGQVLSVYVNATPMAALREYTRWSVLWREAPSSPSDQVAETTKTIAAVMCQDLRDRRLSLFGGPEDVEALLLQCPQVVDRQVVNGTGEGTFHGVESRLNEGVIRALMCTVGNIVYNDPYNAWILSDEEHFNKTQLRELPKECYEDTVRESDAEYINSKWPYSSATSLATILDCIRTRPSHCIRKRVEGGQDEIIAWSLVRVEGQVGMTFTAEAYRGQGMAKRVIYQLAKKLLVLRDQVVPPIPPGNNYATPWTPYCYIDPDNAPSSNMFAGLGFVKVPGQFFWIKA